MLKLLTLTEVEDATGMSRRTIGRREKAGEFPQRRKNGPRRIGWRSDEVEEWIKALPVATDGTFTVAQKT